MFFLLFLQDKNKDLMQQPLIVKPTMESITLAIFALHRGMHLRFALPQD